MPSQPLPSQPQLGRDSGAPAMRVLTRAIRRLAQCVGRRDGRGLRRLRGCSLIHGLMSAPRRPAACPHHASLLSLSAPIPSLTPATSPALTPATSPALSPAPVRAALQMASALPPSPHEPPSDLEEDEYLGLMPSDERAFNLFDVRGNTAFRISVDRTRGRRGGAGEVGGCLGIWCSARFLPPQASAAWRRGRVVRATAGTSHVLCRAGQAAKAAAAVLRPSAARGEGNSSGYHPFTRAGCRQGPHKAYI